MPLQGKIIRVYFYTMETAVKPIAHAREKLKEGTAFFAVCLIKSKAMFKKCQVLLFAFALSAFAQNVMAQEDVKNNKDRSVKDKSDIPVNNETPTKNIEKVVGVWEVTGIYKGTKDITNTDTVGLNRTFEFTRENKFISYSDSEQIDSGYFKLNEVQNLIYLESAAGNEVTEYKIRFDNNTMTLQPAQSADAHAQRFRYVYTRKSDAGN